MPQIPQVEREGKYYEIQLLLLLEKLTVKQITNLKIALFVIKDLQGMDFREGLGYMVQIFLIFNDFLRIRDKMGTIYPTSEWDQTSLESYRLLMTDHNNRIELYLNKEVIGLDELLDFWNRSGAGFSRGIFKNPHQLKGQLGKISYLTIPPMWHSLKRLKHFYGDKFKLPKIPHPIEPHLIDLAEKLPAISKSLKSIMGLPYETDKKEIEHIKDIENYKQPKKKKTKAEIKISSEGRCVIINDEVYKFSSREYDFVQLLIRRAEKTQQWTSKIGVENALNIDNFQIKYLFKDKEEKKQFKKNI